MRIESLRQRIGLLVLMPVGFMLVLVGISGFVFMRGTLFKEWEDASILKLQRAAHQIDMRLGRINDWIEMFYRTSDSRGGPLIQQWILEQIKALDGVTDAQLTWAKPESSFQSGHMSSHRMARVKGAASMMRFNRGRIAEVTPPSYNTETGHETVFVISQLKDASGSLVGNLVVSVDFQYLIKGVKTLAWWQTEQACLVDEAGRYMAHSESVMEGRKRFGEMDDPFELALLKAMTQKPYGTLLGPRRPPDQVGGFYRLSLAPWTVVLFAPGKEVLAPIIRFRNIYFISGILVILSILFLNQTVVGKMVRAFTAISSAAGQVARGRYGKPLPIQGHDEIARLTQSFNAMVDGLKERDFVANTFGRYVDPEIAGKLLALPDASRLGGEKREVAILMSDIRGFTAFSESMSPDRIIFYLNRYFTRLIDVIQAHQGIIVDFFGDGVLVFFDPLGSPVEPVILKSVSCALAMQAAMTLFNREMEDEGFSAFQTGIGVNAGEVVVGNIGSETRAKYGIVGSPVNITQRIQSEAQGGEVIISESVYGRISDHDHVKVQRSFSAALKGTRGEVKLYGVKSINGERG
jgi:adenylate cyclase